MNKFLLKLIFCITLLLSVNELKAGPSSAYAVLISAKVDLSTNSITLNWPVNPDAKTYTVHRKALNKYKREIWIKDTVLGGTVGTYSVKKVKKGIKQEFKIVANINDKFSAYGYISTGIEVTLPHSLGNFVLVVDDTMAAKLPNEINTLINDLRGEGWNVIRKDIKRKDRVAEVKSMLINTYIKLDKKIESILLLGRVPVPYSGSFAPDGHTDHVGAWPADVYYAEFEDETYWLDEAEFSSGSRTENKNFIGDGKFDNDYTPNKPVASIGRVDFSNMSIFGKSESELMRQYLKKDHLFRIGITKHNDKALVDDNFGDFGGEAFASSGYKAFSPMFGDKNIIEGKYFQELKKNSYLFSYACGGGYYTSCAGVGTTDSFLIDSLNTTFTMLFGSYFGDWDSKDNFLRAPLAAKGGCLISVWSGRPQWIFHPMALGGTVSDATKISQYDSSMYYRHPNMQYGITRQISLMGDPSLKLYYPAPPKNLKNVVTNNSGLKTSVVKLTWDKSFSGAKYNVYRARTLDGTYRLLNDTPITAEIYSDNSPLQGKSYYIVRNLQLQNTGSGSYWNESGGLLDSITTQFGTVGIDESAINNQVLTLSIYPNPVNNYLHILTELNNNSTFEIYSMNGKLVQKGLITNSSIEVNQLLSGLYLLQVNNNGISQKVKFIKE